MDKIKETAMTITGNHKITWETDPRFLMHLEQTLLLALREQGILSETGYRRAEENRLRCRHSQGRTQGP